jgi:hypothetical protein
MQETLQEWKPMYEPAALAWEARLFLFYLLLACSFLFLKSASAIRTLWRTRKPDASDNSPQTGAKLLQDLRLCSIKVTSVKKAAVLTFILSFLAFLDGSIRALTAISMQKATGPAVLAGSAAEVLVLFALGIAVCAAQYAMFCIFEGVVARRRAKTVQASAPNKPTSSS